MTTMQPSTCTFTEVQIQHWMTSPEKHIHSVFNDFSRKLYYRNQELLTEINNWRLDQIRLIDEHARKQERLMIEESRKQSSAIDDTRQQFLIPLQSSERMKDYKQVNQLIDNCKALKFELGEFEYPTREILDIQFIPDEKLASKKRTELDAERKENNTYEKKSGQNHGSNEASNVDSYGNSTSQTSSYTWNPATGQVENKISSEDFRSKGNDNNSNCDNKYDEALERKCPACFMIFPSHMTAAEQTQHINEHYKDS